MKRWLNFWFWGAPIPCDDAAIFPSDRTQRYTVSPTYRGTIWGGGHATLRPNGGRSALASGSGRSGATAATRCRVVPVRSLVRSPPASIAGGGFRKHRSLSIAGQNERRTTTSETAEITTSSSAHLRRQCVRVDGAAGRSFVSPIFAYA